MFLLEEYFEDTSWNENMVYLQILYSLMDLIIIRLVSGGQKD